MKIPFVSTAPAEEVRNIRKRLQVIRDSLTAAQQREEPARSALRRLASVGDSTTEAEKELLSIKADIERETALEAELAAALTEAEARAVAAERGAELERLRAQAREAMEAGEKAAKRGKEALHAFMVAWGEVERARGIVDRCDTNAKRHHETDLGVSPNLPGKYQWAGLACEGLSGGRFVGEEVYQIGFYLPDEK